MQPTNFISENTTRIADSILKRRTRQEEPVVVEAVTTGETESTDDIAQGKTTGSVTNTEPKKKKLTGFKDFNKQHPTPPAIERMHEQACKEHWNILIEQLDGDPLLEYEAQLMREKSNSFALNERVIVDHSFPNGRVDLKQLRTMTLNAASGTSDMSSRVVVFNALNELHGLMIDESTRTIATAYGAKQFLQALKQLSSIQSMVQELIRMNKQDQQKNMSAVAKIRAAKNKGDVEELVQIIAGTLAFNLSNSLKDIK
ncbi:hypothetical protein [Vibrio parahaemolyticus]|uniref:hypothetical protein n=1 Tax=Vibrio parahaemolyticus TaxID=670 RepID=UPI00041DC9DE|nr:hypothetical protein [Vibrio parahaemolyticus]KJR17852.1 hypothetical protein UF29_18695 [Vibrio parahaemolyticus]HCE2690158.1 hypothetical protein [Vibrio parahaemolyticus]HCE2915281.1 hypothetical protein [Vibrio parahaemolyticus]HCG8557175.1 hypothetical protein [Vibrio parahaemolyticus]HCH0054395.1 hypothetical protein [Vibrio parahaemolyticus]